MSDLIKGFIVGINNNNNFVYVEVRDRYSSYSNNDDVLEIDTYQLVPQDLNTYDVDIINTKFYAPFILKHNNTIYGFNLMKSDLEDEINDMKYCFHKNALYDLYNSYYCELDSDRNLVDYDMVREFKMGCGDYLFPSLYDSFIIEKALKSYINDLPNDLINYPNLYEYRNGVDDISQKDIDHILGNDKGISI